MASLDTKLLKAARKARGLSQQALADMIGIEQQTFQRLEAGKRDPSVKVLVRLCDALDVSADALLGRRR
jgi:transcriptional regulator with XRE-family HTH domain